MKSLTARPLRSRAAAYAQVWRGWRARNKERWERRHGADVWLGADVGLSGVAEAHYRAVEKAMERDSTGE